MREYTYEFLRKLWIGDIAAGVSTASSAYSHISGRLLSLPEQCHRYVKGTEFEANVTPTQIMDVERYFMNNPRCRKVIICDLLKAEAAIKEYEQRKKEETKRLEEKLKAKQAIKKPAFKSDVDLDVFLKETEGWSNSKRRKAWYNLGMGTLTTRQITHGSKHNTDLDKDSLYWLNELFKLEFPDTFEIRINNSLLKNCDIQPHKTVVDYVCALAKASKGINISICWITKANVHKLIDYEWFLLDVPGRTELNAVNALRAKMHYTTVTAFLALYRRLQHDC